MPHWWCIMMLILMTLIGFLCDVSRLREASYLARAFICEPDCQHALRLPLPVPQLEMNWRWTGAVLLRPAQSESTSGPWHPCHVCRPRGHSAMPENITFLTVTYCLLVISENISWRIFNSGASHLVGVTGKYDEIKCYAIEFVIDDCLKLFRLLWSGLVFVFWFVTAPLTWTQTHV